jgi:cation diffusion facilitator CzcD-associated flavoprotein CzcO
MIVSSPHRLIFDLVGAGQTGLNMGARLKSLDIPTLIIDKLPRVGDQWRIRYPTLTLHTPRVHHTCMTSS